MAIHEEMLFIKKPANTQSEIILVYAAVYGYLH